MRPTLSLLSAALLSAAAFLTFGSAAHAASFAKSPALATAATEGLVEKAHGTHRYFRRGHRHVNRWRWQRRDWRHDRRQHRRWR